jgi:EAL domain-containing protein (putative c-di-GMP-specific phosphodiesterase class I)
MICPKVKSAANAQSMLYSVIDLSQQRAYRYVAQRIRRLRRMAWKERLEVVVYMGYWYGLLEVQEFATLLGRPPTGRLDATRVRFRPGCRP